MYSQAQFTVSRSDWIHFKRIASWRLKRALYKVGRAFNLLVVLMFALLPASPMGAMPTSAEGTAALVTDKGTYSPDEVVLISGSGFEAGDFALPVLQPDATVASGSVTADEGGAFTFEFSPDGGDGTYEARAYPADWSGDWSEAPLASVSFSVTTPPPQTEEPTPDPTEDPTVESTEEPTED